MIELDKASPGDRFEARGGEVWTYVEFIVGRHHLVDQTSDIKCWFCQNGEFGGGMHPSRHDLLRALDAPVPSPEPNESVIAAMVQDQTEYYEAWKRAHFAQIDAPAPVSPPCSAP